MKKGGLKISNAFTIVELIVVVTVIVIIAAIVTVSYTTFTDKAEQTALKAEIKTLADEIGVIRSKKGFYPSSIYDVDTSNITEGTSLRYVGGYNDFCLVGSKDDASFYTKANGAVRDGSCPASPVSCFAFNSSTGTITDYYPREGNVAGAKDCPVDVVIPSKIGGVDVKNVSGTWGSESRSRVESVFVADGVVNMVNTLASASKLISVSLPETLTSMSGTFYNAPELRALETPNSVTALTGNPLTGSSKLELLVIGNGVTQIPGTHFSQATALKKLVIGSSVETIGMEAFRYSPIESIVLPESLRTIKWLALASMQVSSLDLPGGLTTIEPGPGGTIGICNVTDLYIPDSVSSFAAGNIFNNSGTNCGSSPVSVSLPSQLSWAASATGSSAPFRDVSNATYEIRP